MSFKSDWDISERVIFEKFGFKIRLSPWNKPTKILMLISGVIAVTANLLMLLASISIPGVAPISAGIFFLCFGIKQLNDYLDTKNKTLLYVGLAMALIFALDLYSGITQIVNATAK